MPPPHASATIDQHTSHNPWPPNSYQSHDFHTNFQYLHHSEGPAGWNQSPPYPTTPEPYTGNDTARVDQGHQPLEEPALGEEDLYLPNNLIFDFFDNLSRGNDGGGLHGQPTAADAALNSAYGIDPPNAHTADHMTNLLSETKFDPATLGFNTINAQRMYVMLAKDGETNQDVDVGPSIAAPVAQMQPSEVASSTIWNTASSTPVATSALRGLLQLQAIGEGKCEFVSKLGNRCNRPAPRLKAVNGKGEQCCMCISKHLPQWRRSHALFPEIAFVQKTLTEARNDVYPPHEPLAPEYLHADASLVTEHGQQDKWQKRFLEAALTPYEGKNHKLREQQVCFNGCVECDTDGHFSADQVNSRMALLYHVAWNTHMGGERLYAVYGDNSGYPRESPRLTFLQRLEMIEHLLGENKRIVMDVIQGRGVLALVDTPDAYHRRKATNNTNNEFKKRDRPGDGDDDREGGASSSSPPPKKKRTSNGRAFRVKNDGKGKERLDEVPADASM